MSKCRDCGVEPGSRHSGGCDVARCPRCGGQNIGCDCIYEIHGMNVSALEEEHPDVYFNGPTEEMYERWDREWGHRAPAWNGEWPGKEECREYGFWHIEGQRVPPGTPDAREDLNRLYGGECVWDVDKQKMVLRGNR